MISEILLGSIPGAGFSGSSTGVRSRSSARLLLEVTRQVTFLILEQPQKAAWPMLVTPSGILIDVMLEHSAKASLPINLVPFLMS